ncbi:IucA/IucC family C-terminal-domain containing protein [Paenibacillus silviterrae]|uniref:IucA/IucC family C-terminal-domain containing protein n=1 Tax=Paenibacillus silviterrae TaxID=3242194 RepID=UPI00254318DF|nr:IucA/IucC family C-terminal-domain containing protein [Paenibacillus chinjuensis]
MTLSSENKEQLRSTFRILLTEAPSSSEHASLLASGVLEELMQAFAEQAAAPCGKVTGSLWVKRYCSLIAGAFYAFSRWDALLNLSFTHLSVSLNGSGLQFTLPEGCLTYEGSHEEKRDYFIRHVFYEHTEPLFARVSELMGIDRPTLWATLSYLLAYYMEAPSHREEDPELQARIQDDYLFIADKVEEISVDFRAVPSPIDANERILIRSKCCWSFCLPGEDRYCYTCPRITDERRMEKYVAVHGEAAATK